MNTNKTLSIIIPYIVLAAVFAALVQLAAYGFMTPMESSTLAVLDQLSKGADIYASDWGAAVLWAPILQPAYSLGLMFADSATGIAYSMRLIFAVIDFVVALVSYRVLSVGIGRVKGLLVAISYLILASNGTEVLGVYGLGITCSFVSLVFAWAMYRAQMGDDGLSTGYARVLRPVLVGFFAACSFAFSICPSLFCVVSLITLFTLLRALPQKNNLYLFAWCLCGAMLAIAVYLILVLGYGDPQVVIEALVTAVGQNKINLFGAKYKLLLMLATVVFSFVLLYQIRISRISDWERCGIVGLSFALVLAGSIAQGVACILPVMQDGCYIAEGLAEGLVCKANDLDAYNDVIEMSSKVGDNESVDILCWEEDAWANLLFDNKRDDKNASWILVFNDYSSRASNENLLQNCGKIAGNDTCSLYRRATTIGSITQG